MALCLTISAPLSAQQQALSAQEIRLLCSGLGSSTASADSADISIGSDGLRGKTDDGSLSVYQGDELLLQVEDFSFSNYTECVTKLLTINQSSLEMMSPTDLAGASIPLKPCAGKYIQYTRDGVYEGLCDGIARSGNCSGIIMFDYVKQEFVDCL